MTTSIIPNNPVPAQLYLSNFFPVEKVSPVDVVTFIAGVGPITDQIECTNYLNSSCDPNGC